MCTTIHEFIQHLTCHRISLQKKFRQHTIPNTRIVFYKWGPVQYGTILEHGLQNKIDELFAEVHRSHMSKDYSKYKMIKGKKYFKPDVKKVLANF